MSFENVADRRVRDVVADVGQGTLDSVVSPSRILFGKSQHQIHNDLPHTRPACSTFPPVAVVPFSGHQRSMPTENGIRRENRTDLAQHFATQYFSFDCQATSLIVI